jgi:hypothetical protein
MSATKTPQPLRRRAVAILDVDPDLGRDLADEDRSTARSHAIAPLEVLAPGVWDPTQMVQDSKGALGLLVIDGLISRDVVLGSTAFTELIGDGDLLRPWDGEAESEEDTGVIWTVLSPARIAVLDRRFTARAGRWPELMAQLVARAVQRSHTLALQTAICHLQRVETRLLLLLWHLAGRWGKVAADGLVVPLELTHRTLATLVGARRPTVTTALGELAQQGRVSRRPDGSWVLHGDPPDELRQMHATVG